MNAPAPHGPARYRSKTLATWIALIGGSLGLHRFYLHGSRDKLAWLHPWPTLAGAIGVRRIAELGQDDRAAWLLVPLLGLMLSIAMLTAIVYGLMPDERWNARFNAGLAPQRSGWLAVIGVVLALLLGATALMATIAFTTQHFFEWQLDTPRNVAALRRGDAAALRPGERWDRNGSTLRAAARSPRKPPPPSALKRES